MSAIFLMLVAVCVPSDHSVPSEASSAKERPASTDVPFRVIYSLPPGPGLMCGVDSLFVCLTYLNQRDVPLKDLESELTRTPGGVSFDQIVSACNRRGISAEQVVFNGGNLDALPIPAILFVNDNHFLSYFGKSSGKVIFFDNTTGLVEGDPEWFSKHFRWDGAAIVLGGPHPMLWLRTHRNDLLAALVVVVVLGSVASIRRAVAKVRQSHRVRTAFSLIETIIVIAIIGVLLAIGLPAIQKVRIAAWSATCRNNLHNIGVAAHHYHEAHGLFPTDGGGRIPFTPMQDINGSPFVPGESLIIPPLSNQFSLGDPKLGPREQTGSYAFSLLPYLGYEVNYQSCNWQAPVPILACSQRRSAETLTAPLSDEYGSYSSGGWRWARTDYACNFKLFHGRGDNQRISNVTDGTSNTFMAGEKALNPKNYSTGTWFMDTPFFLSQSLGTHRAIRTCLVPDGPDFTYVECWGSPHAGGANFVFADGSVKMISFSISDAVLSAYQSIKSSD